MRQTDRWLTADLQELNWPLADGWLAWVMTDRWLTCMSYDWPLADLHELWLTAGWLAWVMTDHWLTCMSYDWTLAVRWLAPRGYSQISHLSSAGWFSYVHSVQFHWDGSSSKPGIRGGGGRDGGTEIKHRNIRSRFTIKYLGHELQRGWLSAASVVTNSDCGIEIYLNTDIFTLTINWHNLNATCV